MAFCRVLLPLLVLSVAQCFATVDVPVFLWGDLGRVPLKHDALSSVPFNEFGVILKHELQEDPFTVVFIEETLSVEDFATKTYGETAYPYLRAKISNAVYLPSVESPVRVLNKLASPEQTDHVKLTENGLSAELTSQDVKFLFINLEDAKEGESRSELLRRHNDFMEDMYKKLQEQYRQVVAVYTAKFPSWTLAEHSRVRRQAETQSANVSVTDLKFDGVRIYFENVVLLVNGTNEVAFSNGQAGESKVNDTEISSTINFANGTQVTLNFEKSAGYWMLKSANLVTGNPSVDEHLKPTEEVYALLGFSYRCSVNISFSTVNETNPYMVTFQNSRMQAFYTNSTDMQFGDMFNCIGFFTAPIWAGLFVVSILLTIMFYGVMMMMDIKTMDRFDDPKGKTITINAE